MLLRSAALPSDQVIELCTVLREELRMLRPDYKRRIEDQLSDDTPRQVWQDIQDITNYRGRDVTTGNSSVSLAEELNCYFAHFNTSQQNTATPPRPPTASSTPSLTLKEHDARQVLRTVNPREAAGPDGAPGKMLKACADQLSRFFSIIFNHSLTQAAIPSCLKSATIIPVPKKSATDSLNDYRPAALTPVIMKCQIKACLPHTFDTHQFAYRVKRSTEDAIAIALHTALSHLEHHESYVRMLFINYSSAFNTIIPDIYWLHKLYHSPVPG